MPPVLEKLEAEALRLSEADRAVLAEHLVASLTEPVLTDVEEAWVAEAERRYDAYKNGDRKTLTHDDFFSGIRRELGWRG